MQGKGKGGKGEGEGVGFPTFQTNYVSMRELKPESNALKYCKPYYAQTVLIALFDVSQHDDTERAMLKVSGMLRKYWLNLLIDPSEQSKYNEV